MGLLLGGTEKVRESLKINFKSRAKERQGTVL